MESDRPHRTNGTTTSELFICFTSRLSSSSMKISKSILSPGRARDPPVSLSTSLSRRLRTNGSIKGGQASPMFPTAGKKSRCAFENPEPSSPKVTCIGQVRVKSKKKQQGKKLRTLSRRHSTGEVSFRKLEQARDGFSQSQSLNQNLGSSYHQPNVISQESMPQRNQRWVHLPLTICEALRTLGSEFSCLFPCKSSCFSTSEREKEERAAGVVRSSEGNAGQSSCGAVFRWLVALQDGEGGGKGGRQIELVVGGDDDDNVHDSEGRRREFMERGARNSRRHVFDDLQIVDNKIELKDEGGGGGDQEARVSICIPPKNALLLMRCRSDPVKMEALTSKFWESPALPKDDFVEEEEEEEEEKEKERVDEKEFKDCEVELEEEKILVLGEVDEEQQMELKQSIEEENQEATLEMNEEVKEETEDLQDEIEDESMFLDCLFGEFVDEQVIEDVEDPIREEETQAETTVMEEYGEEEEERGAVEELAALEFEAEESIEEKETQDGNFEDKTEMVTHDRAEMKEEEKHGEGGEEREGGSRMKVAKERGRMALPDCLLLMMCEPKLSMEVSRETWVCSTDFIRWQSERKKQVVKPVNGGDESIKKTVNVDAKPIIKSNPAAHVAAAYKETIHQPPRSSCSLPVTAAAASMATMIEQKLVNAVGYEPFVLTRCKSEPMRNASKLVAETCFWKNRKLEPLRRAAAYGVSASGLGF